MTNQTIRTPAPSPEPQLTSPLSAAQLEGFPHKATIRCELYTVEEPGSHLPAVPHVHTLQGRQCSGGYAEMRVDPENDFTAR